MKMRIAPALALGLALTPQAWADEPPERHGAVQEQAPNLEIGLTWVSSLAEDRRVGGENGLSADFVVTKRYGDSLLTLYVEGSTTPSQQAVLAEGNGDAGSAVDHGGTGRFQVSELHMTHSTSWGEFSYGPLINPAGYLDASEVANDETTQFLAPTLVNNSSIQMPDYTAGLALHREAGGGMPGVTIFVGASHGLADNPNHSYSELFDLGAAGKGLFTAIEGYLEREGSLLRLGGWGRSDSGRAYGYYADADLLTDGAGNWSLRWGQTEAGAGEVSGFTSVAWELPSDNRTLGLGYADQALSDGSRATTTEAYLRLTIADGLELTPSVQWLQNPGFDASGSSFDARQTLYHLRLNKAI